MTTKELLHILAQSVIEIDRYIEADNLDAAEAGLRYLQHYLNKERPLTLHTNN